MLKRFLLSYLLLCIAPFILLGFIVSSITDEAVGKELLNAARISLDESYSSVRAIDDNAKSLSLTIATDEDVQGTLRTYRTESAPFPSLQALERALRKYRQYSGSSVKVRVALLSGGHPQRDGPLDLVTLVDENAKEPWLLESEEAPGQFSWSLYMDNNATYLRQCKAIYDMENWHDILGYTIIDVNLESMRSIAMKSNTNGSRLYLVEQDGTILYPYYNYDKIPQNVLTSTTRETHVQGDSMLLARPVTGTRWKLIKTLPFSDLRNKTNSIRRTIQAVALVFTGLSLVAILYYYMGIAKPIARLGRRMSHVQAGELIPIASPAQRGEIANLYQSYNYMVQHLKEQIDRTYVSQINTREAELKALQAQINPHFLYNTLDSINWLALRYQADDISQMVVALSDMLRLSLNRGDTIIQLKNELRQVDSYITLQKIRYSNRFDVHYDIGDGIGDCYVVKMLLQPLVENAIIHGFENIEEGGLIQISIRRREGMLAFEVCNNGALIDLKEMEKRIESQHNKNEFMHGYGIKNVNERLASHYGGQYRILYCVRDGLTIATITIPEEVTFA